MSYVSTSAVGGSLRWFLLSRLWLGGLLCLGFTGWAGCGGGSDSGENRTAVLVRVSVAEQVQSQIFAAKIEVKGAASYDALEEAGPEQAHLVQELPATLRLEPQEADPTRVFAVYVEGVDEDLKPVVWARLVSGFVAGEVRQGELVLEADCAADTCEAFATCQQAGCVDGRVEPTDLVLDGQDGTPGAGTGGDDGTGGADTSEADPCDALVCDHGSCVLSGATAACLCDEGYTGTLCATPVDPCFELNCANGGECLVRAGTAECSCPEGFSGALCQVDDSACSDPCNPLLDALEVSGGTLVPAWDPEQEQYTLEVSMDTDRVRLTPNLPAGMTVALGETLLPAAGYFEFDLVTEPPATLALEVSTGAGTSRTYELLVTPVRPSWASAAGWDTYGLWASFAVGTEEVVMRRIPSGRFLMGSSAGEEWREADETQHVVNLSHGYWLAATETTQALWELVMGYNDSVFDYNLNKPAESLSWHEASLFLDKLNGMLSGFQGRLPTEAEWEYACRAETTAATYGAVVVDLAWYVDNSNDYTHPVGEKAPNAYGLYDMLGNAEEWCADWYGIYPTEEQTDPTGPATGQYRVVRGGHWAQKVSFIRAASRESAPPDRAWDSNGFRIASGP